MLVMSNQSYLSVWCRQFSEERMLGHFGRFLEMVPFSTTKPGFRYLVVRAVDPSEAPVVEQDLRAVPLDAAGILELVKEHLHSDASYEVQCHWDLWMFDPEGRWKLEPQPLEVSCRGQDYGDRSWQETGHIEASLGFEHLFTGHARLLGKRQGERAEAQSLEEARFLEAMAWPENLQRYQEKTQENIRRLLDWTRKIERAISVDHLRLWSEGEENFEARLEEILVAN
jgi:hypothetical protein